MANTVPTNGLLRAQEALIALAEDPQRLELARERFINDVPPRSRSPAASLETTRSQSLSLPSEEQQRREQWEWQLRGEYHASYPSKQFDTQVGEERQRLIDGLENGTLRVPMGVDFFMTAKKNIMRDWHQQGIWNSAWETATVWRWKHEELLDPASPASPASTASAASAAGSPSPIRSEHDASRPFQQFMWQVLQKAERILEGGRAAIPHDADIHTRAYEAVKSTWIRRGIWDTRWGVLPGTFWKHEQPLKEMLSEIMGDDYTPTTAAPTPTRSRAEERPNRRPVRSAPSPTRNIFGPPVNQGASLFGSDQEEEEESSKKQPRRKRRAPRAQASSSKAAKVTKRKPATRRRADTPADLLHGAQPSNATPPRRSQRIRDMKARKEPGFLRGRV